MVNLYGDGTKERIYNDVPSPIYPESLDLKITNYCVGAGCQYCHEQSDGKGKHADPEFIKNIFKDVPKGMEIAIGGGNPLSHPALESILTNFKDRGLVPNMTVNSLHLQGNMERLRDLDIYGLGISYNPTRLQQCIEVANSLNNVVFHVIMGVNTLDELNTLVNNVKNPKVLLLGYKQFGRGVKYYSESIKDKLYKWYTNIHTFFNHSSLTLSFDNLGITQLNLPRFFTPENWDKFYMGNDGNYTMYIDAVNQQYAVSSTSERHDIGTKQLKEMFKDVRRISTNQNL